MSHTAVVEFDTDPGAPRFPPGTVNGRLLDAILRHRHYVLRVENAIILNLLGPLNDAKKAVLAELAALAAREGALSDFGRMRRAQLLELERRIENAITFAAQETLTRSLGDFRRFAEREVEVQNKLLAREIPRGIILDLTGPDAARVEEILRTPLGGELWELRIVRNYGAMVAGMQRDLSTSLMLGEGIGQAVRRLERTVNTVGRNRLITLARSEIQRVANATAAETYRANRSVIKGTQVYETLDDRTCLICATKDGKFHDLASTDLPPYHAACRGFVAPVTKSLTEMGLALDDFPPSTRASMNGQVPETVTYPEWFGRQSPQFQRDWLGPTRYELFRAGVLSIDDMVRDLRILPIDELPAMTLGAA